MVEKDNVMMQNGNWKKKYYMGIVKMQNRLKNISLIKKCMLKMKIYDDNLDIYEYVGNHIRTLSNINVTNFLNFLLVFNFYGGLNFEICY